MQMSGEQLIAAPRQRVWEGLNDPAILQACIPGCQTLEKEGDDRFNATVELKIGPIGARFKGAVTLSELNPPTSYVITGQGNGGIAGSAKGGAKVSLADHEGGTMLTYTVDAEVGGRMAQLGGPIIDATAKQLAGRFFSKFGETLVPAASAASATAGTPTAAALPAAAVYSSAPAPRRAASGFSFGWVVAVILAIVVGFLAGRGGASALGGSDWPGLAIGLVIVLVAALGFEYGRRATAPVLALDSVLLRRLLESARE
jgi:carbon monoxide dehydrogenase subunit G